MGLTPIKVNDYDNGGDDDVDDEVVVGCSVGAPSRILMLIILSLLVVVLEVDMTKSCVCPLQLTLWDTGGMERMSFIGGSYYRGAHAALLVYNTNNRDTFTILSQYFLDIAMNAETAKIFVCGNDGEAAGPGPVEDADMESFSKESEGIVSGMYQVSCISNTGLEHMFRDMARVLHAAAMDRLTLRRDIIQPGHTPGDVMATHAHEDDETNGRRKRCC